MTIIDKLVALYKEADNSVDCIEDDGFAIIDEGEWTQHHKTQSADHIVSLDGQFFCITESRSGSCHTDWYYDDAVVQPVERHEETKVVVSWKQAGPHVMIGGRN